MMLVRGDSEVRRMARGKCRNADRLAELMAAAGNDLGPRGLISSYMAAAQRQVDHFQHRYPHEDVEPAVMQALYLAAYTFDGRGAFYWWFKSKLFGQTSQFRLAAKHREIGYLRRSNWRRDRAAADFAAETSRVLAAIGR